MRADRSGDVVDGPVRELKGKKEQDAAFSLRLRGGWAQQHMKQKMTYKTISDMLPSR